MSTLFGPCSAQIQFIGWKNTYIVSFNSTCHRIKPVWYDLQYNLEYVVKTVGEFMQFSVGSDNTPFVTFELNADGNLTGMPIYFYSQKPDKPIPPEFVFGIQTKSTRPFPIYYNFRYDKNTNELIISLNGDTDYNIISNNNVINGPSTEVTTSNNMMVRSNVAAILNTRSNTQPKQRDTWSTQPTQLYSLLNCDLDNIPRIFINKLRAQGAFITDIDFTITNFTRYSCESSLIPCSESDRKIYRTNFVRPFPIDTVLKGCGLTEQKINEIMITYNIQYMYSDFLLLLSFYAATRYILSFCLTGVFDMKFLLGKYYDNFLLELRASEYYKFEQIFTNLQTVILGGVPTLVDFSVYYQYFLFDYDRGLCCGGNNNRCQIIIEPRTVR